MAPPHRGQPTTHWCVCNLSIIRIIIIKAPKSWSTYYIKNKLLLNRSENIIATLCICVPLCRLQQLKNIAIYNKPHLGTLTFYFQALLMLNKHQYSKLIPRSCIYQLPSQDITYIIKKLKTLTCGKYILKPNCCYLSLNLKI